jgi:hypothetical protein
MTIRDEMAKVIERSLQNARITSPVESMNMPEADAILAMPQIQALVDAAENVINAYDEKWIIDESVGTLESTLAPFTEVRGK